MYIFFVSEKGICYPDITILPTLARILKTDLNTLLSFQEELSMQEIGLFLNELTEIASEKGFEKAYEVGMEKIREYPTCYILILNVALAFDGLMMMQINETDMYDRYRNLNEELYERVLQSDESTVKNQAQSILISRYMQRKEYTKAEELLTQLPDSNGVDKRQLQVNLFIAKGQLAEAAKLEESILLSTANKTHGTLLTLMDIAIKDNRLEDATYMADVAKQTAEIYDLAEYTTFVGDFQLYAAQKNKKKCIGILVPMLKSLSKKWNINSSPLYKHIKTKQNEEKAGFDLRKTLISALKQDKDYNFLKNEPELLKVLNED